MGKWLKKDFCFFFPLKLTASLHLKMDGWNTIRSFWDGNFSGAVFVLGSVVFSTIAGRVAMRLSIPVGSM